MKMQKQQWFDLFCHRSKIYYMHQLEDEVPAPMALSLDMSFKTTLHYQQYIKPTYQPP